MTPLPDYLVKLAEELRLIRQHQQTPSREHVIKQAEKVAKRQFNS